MHLDGNRGRGSGQVSEGSAVSGRPPRAGGPSTPSCDSLAGAGPWYISQAFTRGTEIGTRIVGLPGLSEPECVSLRINP